MKAIFLVFICSLSCFAQNATPPVNEKAPDIELSRLLQAPHGTASSLAALRGKAVVMEFWATWCGPCVAAVPHLNELAEQYEDKPVTFLSITDEDYDVVSSFLKKRPISGWVGIDKDGHTFAKYGVTARPQMILIDHDGVLRSTPESAEVTPPLIDALISGMPMASEKGSHRPPTVPMELAYGVPPPLLQVLIRPAAPPGISGYAPGKVTKGEGGRIEYFGVNLRTLLVYAKKMRGDRIEAPKWFDQSLYDVSTIVPSGRDDLRNSLLEENLMAAFSLQVQSELRPTSIYVITTSDRAKLRSSNGKESAGFLTHPGQFTGVGTSILRLTFLVSQNVGGAEVIDETGLTGHYDFDLVWQSGNVESLQSALRDQLGLTIRKEVRDREYYVVKEATQPTTW